MSFGEYLQIKVMVQKKEKNSAITIVNNRDLIQTWETQSVYTQHELKIDKYKMTYSDILLN